jgi:tyrosyl-tRNA synthetase
MFIDFLRDIGKFITVNYMLAKETVKTRLEGEGISYTEFTYMLIQGYDFYHLFKNKGVKMQVGGSDQWGNITAGLEIIRKKNAGEAYALAFQLLTDSQGKKFGKSAGNAIWLNPAMTSPYRLHQYLLNTPDSDVLKVISYITLATPDKIAVLGLSLKKEPEKRVAQNFLADTVCSIIHGEAATAEARKAAGVLFGGSLNGISSAQLLDIFAEVPSKTMPRASVLNVKVPDLFAAAGAVKSKGEIKRLVESGGAYLNNQKVESIERSITSSDLIDGRLLILRTGKKNYCLVNLSDG